MRISRAWIADFIADDNLEPEEVAERLSSTLAEVEAIEKKRSWLGTKIIIARIVSLASCPRADRLQIAKIQTSETSKKLLTVVCGANNIAPGQIVPLVLPGGRVLSPNGQLTTVNRTRIRGVVSEAMMCSQLELGIGEDHTGIWILPPEWKNYLGKPLIEILPEVKDIVWEIENKALTHRPDCFGQIGMAREVAAACNLKFNLPKWYQDNWSPVRPGKEKFSLQVEIKDKKSCPRYTAIAIQGVKIAPSPIWLQQRLINIGLRPINNVVDATNYVMMELGQPMHAFDADKLIGRRIIVRRAKNGEQIETLDGEVRLLSIADLVIADRKRAIALAGIIGGAKTEIDGQTKTVVLESANFNKAVIRRSAMRLGVRTEASLRFEKGLDPDLTRPALGRAVELILASSPKAKVVSELIDCYPQPIKQRKIKAAPQFINKILGARIDAGKMVSILQSLSLSCQLKNNFLEVIVPSFRSDLKIPEDLVEEVGRIYGYDRLPLVLPKKDLAPVAINQEFVLARKIKEILVSFGFDEVYTYAFIGADVYKKCRLGTEDLIPLQNPISPELAFLKNSLVPSLIDKASLNAPNFEDFAIFELARVFRYQADKKKRPYQPKNLAGLMLKSDQKDNDLFLVVKGYLEKLFKRALVFQISYKPSSFLPYFHPVKAVEVYSGKKRIGSLGLIHPLVADEFGIKGKSVAVFEIDFEALKKVVKNQIKYSPPIKASLINIDLSLKVKNWQQAEEKIKLVFGKSLVKMKLIGFYQEKCAVRLWLTASEETKSGNLQKLINKVIAS